MSGSILFNAIVLLAGAVICVPIAKKLGLSSVLGYLLAGIIVGPYVLGFIGQEGEDIMHFAEFGVVMMLFLIGLEIEPKNFWEMRKTSFVIYRHNTSNLKRKRTNEHYLWCFFFFHLTFSRHHSHCYVSSNSIASKSR